MIADEYKFEITRRIFWSHSKTVLHWIKKDPREFKIFVANRLEEFDQTHLLRNGNGYRRRKIRQTTGLDSRLTRLTKIVDGLWVLLS